MKTPLVVLLLLSLGAVTASAQLHKMKEKARNLDDKMTERHNAAENGAPPPGPPAKGGAPAANPAAPAMANVPPAAPVKPATQQQAATKLKADILAARTKGEVTAEAKAEFARDLKLAVMGSGKPTVASLDSFAATFLPVVAGKGVSAVSDSRLVQNIVVSLNSAGLSAARVAELSDEVKTALTKAGAPEGDAASVAGALGKIIAEVQTAAVK